MNGIIELDMESRPLVMDYLRRFPTEVSEISFTNLFVWRKRRPIWLLEDRESLTFLCELQGRAGKFVIGPSIGGDHDPEELRRAVPELNGYIRIPEADAVRLKKACLAVSPDEDNWDYVYSKTDLAELKGEKYHKKRNLVYQCIEENRCRYQTLSADLISDCIGALDNWCFIKREELTLDIGAEYQAIREMFANYDTLDLFGGAVMVDGCVQAYAVGERLTDDTAVCHFEKASPEIKGLSQVMNQWFAMYAAKDFTYINREQDLGIEGLRQAKRAYHPHHMVKKFTATFKEATG